MPSTVVTALSAAPRAGIRQLATGAPSSSTVQAPQTPAPHTSFVPVRFSVSRRTSISSASGSSGSGASRPLTVIVLIGDLQSGREFYAPRAAAMRRKDGGPAGTVALKSRIRKDAPARLD